jgi:hypothetical protein
MASSDGGAGQIPDAPVLLSVGRLTARKELREFVKKFSWDIFSARLLQELSQSTQRF